MANQSYGTGYSKPIRIASEKKNPTEIERRCDVREISAHKIYRTEKIQP